METSRGIKILEADYLEIKGYAESKHLPLMIVISRAVRKYLRGKKVDAYGKSKQ